MNRIDEITPRDGEIFVRGWLFEPGKVVSGYRYEEKGKRYDLSGFGLDSPDLIGSFGEEATCSRFEFTIPVPEPNGILVFDFECGSTTVIPLSRSLDSQEPIDIRLHQIENGRYYGGFQMGADIQVNAVVISSGAPDSPDAISVSKNEFRPAPLRPCHIEERDAEIRTVYVEIPANVNWSIDDLNVHFIQDNGAVHTRVDIGKQQRSTTEAYLIPHRFFKWLEETDKSLAVLELGSRARSGNTNRDKIPAHHRYIGFDLLEGENVDVVGDAHCLSELVEHNSLDAVFGVSVIEHLAMPWKVALELNRTLKRGGRAMFFTHQAWPLHDSPFDFWRYSRESWPAIFNASSGFKVLSSAVGDPGRIHPEIQTNASQHLSDTLCYLVSSVLVEKIGETKLAWDVPLDEVYDGFYPE